MTTVKLSKVPTRGLQRKVVVVRKVWVRDLNVWSVFTKKRTPKSPTVRAGLPLSKGRSGVRTPGGTSDFISMT